MRSNSRASSQGGDDGICGLCCNLIKLFAVLALLGGFVSIFALGIYFLVIDHEKGGSCAQSVGNDIWIYFLIKTIVGVATYFASCFTGSDAKNHNGDNSKSLLSVQNGGNDVGGAKVTVILSTLILHVGMLAYGGVVLIHETVCESYERTGLYQMAYALFFLDCTFLFFACAFALLKWFACSVLAGGDDENGLTAKLEI